ncbi:MAG: hypothetical protein AAGG44_09740 [Planctomycetota bacterium]
MCTVSTLSDPYQKYSNPPNYCRYLTDDNPKDALRLVGYVEYQTALDRFDELLQLAGPKDLAIMDEIIQERPEFTVSLQRESMSSAFKSTAWGPEGDGSHLGLDWVIALARVEVAATLASFVYVNNGNGFPDGVTPKDFERGAYRALALDGLIFHMQLVDDQDVLDALRNPSATTRVLAILRRIQLAEGLHREVLNWYRDDMQSEQRADLLRAAERLANAKQMVIQNLLKRISK